MEAFGNVSIVKVVLRFACKAGLQSLFHTLKSDFSFQVWHKTLYSTIEVSIFILGKYLLIFAEEAWKCCPIFLISLIPSR